MRVLLTAHQFLPKHAFGTERLTFDTGRELLKRGHDVHVLTTDTASPSLPHNAAWDYEYKGLQVRVIGLRLGTTPDPLRYEFDNPEMAEHMRAMMRQASPDLVHVVHAGRLSGSIVPAAKEFGVPIVFTATDFWSVCRVIHLKRADTGKLCLGPDRAGTNCMRCFVARSNASPEDKETYLKRSDLQFRALSAAARSPLVRASGRASRTRTVLERISYLKEVVNASDRVVSPTRLNRDLLIRNGIEPRKILLSRYGIDTSDVETAPRSPDRPTGIRFGYIGSLARHKGADVLIRAFTDSMPRIADAELKIYGSPLRDPGYFKELEQLAEIDGRVKFLGTFEGDKIGWVFSDLDVLVVPSAWYENTPLVVNYAFASGTPVVATNLGGLSEVIEHDKNGLLFQMNDSRGLGTQLARFLHDPDLIAKLRSGIEPVKTAAQGVDELESLYLELLASGRSSGRTGAVSSTRSDPSVS